jgi:N-acetyl sugar amidotransferase
MNNNQSLETYFGLPSEVKFCKKCVMSNQRPASTVEFKHNKESKKVTLNIDEDGVCDACRTAEQKTKIDWDEREKELIKLLNQHRSKDGSYDCLVPGSGGKDSAYQAHVLKYKYGMNPLTITWPPILYTDYGYKNWKNWVDSGFDNVAFNRNGKVMKLLTKLSIENLLHPFQTFILGQKNLAPKIASQYGINLIFYGENEAEYGNPIADNMSSLRDKSYFSFTHLDDIYLGGVSVGELKEKYHLNMSDIKTFLPPTAEELEKAKIEVHYLGYYLKWTPQEVYYYAVENTGFQARPFRTQGTYSKYNSIDDKIDDFTISEEQFNSFKTRHGKLEQITKIVYENNNAMKGSYAMVDPAGRFYDNAEGKHNYSDKINNVGVFNAIQQVNYSSDKFLNRGGVYNWERNYPNFPQRITLSGELASEQSTIGKLLAEKLNYHFISIGNKTREYAHQQGMSIVEFQNYCLNNPEIDKQIDIQFSKECNATENNVIDYRLGFKFIENAFHVLLQISENTAIERLTKANRVNETHETVRVRNRAFKTQFQSSYGVDYTNPTHYDLLINVEDFDHPEQIAAKILSQFA